MNQDNGLNQNNVNFQGTDGISNNQNFNQGTTVNQQTAANYEPQIIQEQPAQNTTTFDNGGNAQSFITKTPKKMSLGSIIGIIVVILFALIIGGVLLFTNVDNPGGSSKDGHEMVIYNEEYVVNFTSPKDWFLGSDEIFNKSKYGYIKGFVKEEGENYSISIENANVLITDLLSYDNKDEYINGFLKYRIDTANKLLTDGLEKKVINKHEVYYYIDGNILDMDDPVTGIKAYVFIDDQYCVEISARLQESNGYKTKDLENYVHDIVKSLKISKNNGQYVIEEEKTFHNDEKLEGLKYDTLDDYYNIDTSKFDKEKFNGKINFFGFEVDGKITTHKLKELGIESDAYWESGALAIQPNENGFYCGSARFSIDTTAGSNNSDFQMPDMDDFIYLCNYTGGDNVYSDNTLVSWGNSWNTTGRNVYPSQFDIDSYKDITIDLVIEKLGNPTYVDKRTSKNITTLYGYTTYYYIYDEVGFLFSFYNWQNLKLASVFYYPIEELDGTAYPNDDKSVIDVLIEDHNKYLEN